MESESLIEWGLEIPRDYKIMKEELFQIIPYAKCKLTQGRFVL